jgi:hypothetical protein
MKKKKKTVKDKKQIITYPKKSDETKYMKSFVYGTENEGRKACIDRTKKIDDWKIIDPVVSTERTPIHLKDRWRRLNEKKRKRI